jgi:heat shock protein HtpX
MSNNLKTTALLALLTALLLWIGQYFGGAQGMLGMLIVAAVINLGSYWFSDKIVLRMYGARELGPGDAPELHSMVRELATAGQMPMPRLYLIPSESPNAFATGRNPQHAAVAVTDGILRLLSRDELKGVLAHELSHVGNRDTLISAVAATLAGVIMMLSRWAIFFGGGRRDDREGGGGLELIALMILGPIAAMLIQFAISRSREYQADATGARLCHSPMGLASALEKIGVASRRIPLPASPATAHLFIVNPLRGSWLANLFSTHPPIEQRIQRLRSMAY